LGVAIKYQAGVSTTGGGNSNRVNALSLQTGACFQDPGYRHSARRVAGDVTPVPCTRAHNAQIYARFAADGGPAYPGRTVLNTQASQDCRSVLGTRLDGSKLSPRIVLVNVVPSSASWSAGQRTISCALVESTAHLTRSLIKMPGHG
jgi:hypothetical protein